MSKRSRGRNKQLRNRRKKQKLAVQGSASSAATGRILPAGKLNRRTVSRLAEATNLINNGQLSEAEEILTEEDRRHNGHPSILEDLLWLYQIQQDHLSATLTAERLLRVRPRDAEVRLSLAQGYLFTGRTPMAWKAYQEFLNDWPDHEHASKAEAALEIAERQVATMLDTFELSEDEFDLLLLHDEILFELSASRMENAVEKARKLLAVKPHLVSARNNLALALFQLGRMQDAVSVCRETLQHHPGNRFAEASLGRYLMLSGHDDEANVIADKIASSPADQQDAMAQQVEFLSMLGRDEDVLKLVAFGEDIPDMDPKCCAVLSHHRAVALAREGELREAENSWQEAIDFHPHFEPAKENLTDLKTAGSNSHAPWPEPFSHWIPRGVSQKFTSLTQRLTSEGAEYPLSEALKRFPHLRNLVPALLDRGDKNGRVFAFTLAKAVKSPDFLDALHDFAFSTRGPDKLRNEALSVLRENNRLGPGPHRVFHNGEWKDIELFSPEITDEPHPVKTPALQELHEEGYFALSDDDPEKAESIFRRCIELDPEDPTSRHNLAGALMRYDDEESAAAAREILNDLLERFPDYSFARTSLAQLAIEAGDLQRARDLIAPLKQRTQMHRSEIMAYFSVVGELSFAGNALESVEHTVSMMEQIDPDHPNTSILRRRLDFVKGGSSALLQRQPLAIPGGVRER